MSFILKAKKKVELPTPRETSETQQLLELYQLAYKNGLHKTLDSITKLIGKAN